MKGKKVKDQWQRTGHFKRLQSNKSTCCAPSFLKNRRDNQHFSPFPQCFLLCQNLSSLVPLSYLLSTEALNFARPHICCIGKD